MIPQVIVDPETAYAYSKNPGSSPSNPEYAAKPGWQLLRVELVDQATRRREPERRIQELDHLVPVVPDRLRVLHPLLADPDGAAVVGEHLRV